MQSKTKVCIVRHESISQEPACWGHQQSKQHGAELVVKSDGNQSALSRIWGPMCSVFRLTNQPHELDTEGSTASQAATHAPGCITTNWLGTEAANEIAGITTTESQRHGKKPKMEREEKRRKSTLLYNHMRCEEKRLGHPWLGIWVTCKHRVG